MKRSLTTMVLLAAGLTLGGCVDDYGGGYGGVYSAGAYPYGSYYGGYPGGYYRGSRYYGSYPRDRDYRPEPRAHWNGRDRDQYRGTVRNEGERGGWTGGGHRDSPGAGNGGGYRNGGGWHGGGGHGRR